MSYSLDLMKESLYWSAVEGGTIERLKKVRKTKNLITVPIMGERSNERKGKRGPM